MPPDSETRLCFRIPPPLSVFFFFSSSHFPPVTVAIFSWLDARPLISQSEKVSPPPTPRHARKHISARGALTSEAPGRWRREAAPSLWPVFVEVLGCKWSYIIDAGWKGSKWRRVPLLAAAWWGPLPWLIFFACSPSIRNTFLCLCLCQEATLLIFTDWRSALKKE